MDVAVILWLQQIREALGPLAETLISYMSDLLVFLAVIVPFLYYWCTDKEEGKDILLALGISLFLNQFLKVTFSVYRPWINDPSVIPAAAARPFASGYSFPSGHTQVCGTIFGSIASAAYEKNRKVSVLCMIAIILTAVSRVFLGVHTPQDVLAGLLIAAVSVALINRGDAVVDSHPQYRRYLTWAAAVLSAAGIAYALGREYPMDYINGELIVDPIDMIKDALLCIGSFFGIFAGTALERTYLNFQTDGSRKEKALRFLIGSGIIGLILLGHRLFGLQLLAEKLSAFVRGTAVGLFAMYLYPLLFTHMRAVMKK